MSCENGYLPTSTLANLILRSNGNSLLNGNGLVNEGQETGLTFPDIDVRSTALDQDRLAGVRSLQIALARGELDTGSGLAEELFGDSSRIYDTNGNLLESAGSLFNGGEIDPSTLDGFLDTSAVFSEIEDFSSNLDLTSAENTFGRETIVDTTNALNGFLNSGFNDSERFPDLSSYPNLSDRLTSVPALSFTEVGDWLVTSETDPNDLLTAIGNFDLNSDTSAFLINSLGSLEDYYTSNIGADIARGLCSASASIIQKILGILVIIDTAKEVITLIKNIFELDLIKLAEQLLARLTIEAIVKLIKETIQKIYDKIRARILRIIEKFKDMICNLKGAKHRAMSTLGKACTELEDFYSDENLDTFQKRIEAFITKLTAEFERLTFENVILLLQRLCDFVNLIQQLLFNPILAFQELGRTFAAEDRMARSVSLKNTKYAVEHGALRLSPEDRRVLQEEARKSINAKSASIQELIDGESTDYVTAKEISCDEAQALFCLKDEGVPGSFTFSGSILEGKPKNYKLVKPIVYARLMRMAARLDKEFVVVKGFEKKEDDKEKVGSADNSIMASGGAIHIQASGFQEQAEIIVSASQEGFVGIGVHSGYIHLDIGPRKLTWVAGYSDGFQQSDDAITELSTSAKLARLLDRHEKKEFTRKVE